MTETQTRLKTAREIIAQYQFRNYGTDPHETITIDADNLADLACGYEEAMDEIADIRRHLTFFADQISEQIKVIAKFESIQNEIPKK